MYPHSGLSFATCDLPTESTMGVVYECGEVLIHT